MRSDGTKSSHRGTPPKGAGDENREELFRVTSVRSTELSFRPVRLSPHGSWSPHHCAPSLLPESKGNSGRQIRTPAFAAGALPNARVKVSAFVLGGRPACNCPTLFQGWGCHSQNARDFAKRRRFKLLNLVSN